MKKSNAGFIFLILITIFLTADQAALIPNYLLIEKEFGITHAQMGIVSSVFIIIGALATLLWGYLTDKYSRKKLLIIGTLMGEIPCFLTAFVTNYAQLFTVRAATGLGIGMILPVSLSLLGDYFPSKERGKGSGWLLFATGVGYLFGAGIAGIIGPNFNWRYTFIIVAIPNLFLIPLFHFLVKEPKRGEGEAEVKEMLEAGAIYTYTAKLSDFKKAITIKTNLFLNLQSFFGCLPFGILSSWVITFFAQEKGFSVTMATALMMSFIGIRVVGNVIGGYLGDYLCKKRIVYRTILCIFSIFLGIPFIIGAIKYQVPPDPVFYQILPLFLIGSLGAVIPSIASPNARAILLDTNVPENRGTIFSVANLTDIIGGGIGPLLGGILADKYGLSFTLIISTLFWIPCAILWLPLLKTVPLDMGIVKKKMKERSGLLRL
jgi:MFS family permease